MPKSLSGIRIKRGRGQAWFSSEYHIFINYIGKVNAPENQFVVTLKSNEATITSTSSVGEFNRLRQIYRHTAVLHTVPLPLRFTLHFYTFEPHVRLYHKCLHIVYRSYVYVYVHIYYVIAYLLFFIIIIIIFSFFFFLFFVLFFSFFFLPSLKKKYS